MDIAFLRMGGHLTQESRIQNAFDDVASTIHQSLGPALSSAVMSELVGLARG
jgi:hypothetical protein